MISSLLQILIIIAVLVFLEVVVEPRYSFRDKLTGKLGPFKVYFLLIVILVLLDLFVSSTIPSVENNDIYKYSKLAILVYFLPKGRKGGKRDG